MAPAGSKGTWLSVFYCAIPVGTAIGYAYSALMAESVGWEFAFFLEAIVMAPFVFFLFAIAHHFPCHHHAASQPEHSAVGGSDSKTLLSVTREEDAAMRNSHNSGTNNNSNNNSTVHAPPTMIQEFLVVTSKPVFLCLVAGYAAQTGALIGLSTFGSAFMMGLGYFDSQSEASTVFGALVCIAGLIGTILGGVLLDRMLVANAGDGNVVAAMESAVVAVGSRLSFDDSSDHYTTRARRNSDEIMRTLLDPEHHPRHRRKPGEEEHAHELRNITKLISASSLVGFLCLILSYFIFNKGFYLFIMMVGCLFIFVCGSGINMGVMLSVPQQHRSFGIGIMAVCIHVFGDVPSPVIAGLIKDYLAPGCVPSASDSDDGSVATSDACRADEHGLRVTMLIIDAWLVWTVVFFVAAWYLNKIQKVRCGCCVRTMDMCGVRADQAYVRLEEEHEDAGDSADLYGGPIYRQPGGGEGGAGGASGSHSSNSGRGGGGGYENPTASTGGKGSGGGGGGSRNTSHQSNNNNTSSSSNAGGFSGGVNQASDSSHGSGVAENYNVYAANKRHETQRSRSKDSGRSVSGESASSRTLRLSNSLSKANSTEDILSSFSIASTLANNALIGGNSGSGNTNTSTSNSGKSAAKGKENRSTISPPRPSYKTTSGTYRSKSSDTAPGSLGAVSSPFTHSALDDTVMV